MEEHGKRSRGKVVDSREESEETNVNKELRIACGNLMLSPKKTGGKAVPLKNVYSNFFNSS